MRRTIALATATKMSAYQQQQRHHDQGNNTSLGMSTEGDDASSMAETRLRINNGNNAIVTRAAIAIAAMAKMPAHQWQ
jgi:hypothetical protein